MIIDKKKLTNKALIAAIDSYEAMCQKGIEPDFAMLHDNAFLAYVYYVDKITSLPESSLNCHTAMNLFAEMQDHLSNQIEGKVRHGYRCLRAGIFLIYAWLDEKIAQLALLEDVASPRAPRKEASRHHSHKTHRSYFQRALEEEAYYVANKSTENVESNRNNKALYSELMLEAPVTNGLAHHIHAQLLWGKMKTGGNDSSPEMRNINEAMTVAAKLGFDYREYAFSSPMVTAAMNFVNNKPSDTPALAIELEAIPASALLADHCVYPRQQQRAKFPLLEIQSIRLIGYTHVVRHLSAGNIASALNIIGKMTNAGELSYLCDHSLNESADVVHIKSFWQQFFARSYPTLRNNLLDAIISYYRDSAVKNERVALRNKMLVRLIEIDGLGNHSEDKQKVRLIKKDILPLILKLACTDLSSEQKAGLKSKKDAFVRRSLSQLAKNCIKILVNTTGVEPDEINAIAARLTKDGADDNTADLELARQGVNQYIRMRKEKRNKQLKQWPAWDSCEQQMMKHFGEAQYSSTHPLLPFAIFEKHIAVVNTDNDTKAFAKAIKGIDVHLSKVETQQYDLRHILLTMTRKASHREGITVFSLLTKQGKIHGDDSLWDFQHSGSIQTKCSEQIRTASSAYIIGIALCAYQKFELAAHYLAKAYHFSRSGAEFQHLDYAFLMQLFHQRNWQHFSTTLKGSVASYIKTRTTSTDEQKSDRVKYAASIAESLGYATDERAQSQSEDGQEEMPQLRQLNDFLDNQLWKFLYLSGINLGLSQKMAMRAGKKSANLCELTSDAINNAVNYLGLTSDQFTFALDKAKAEAFKNKISMGTAFSACEAYFKKSIGVMQTELENDDNNLTGFLLPFLAKKLAPVEDDFNLTAVTEASSTGTMDIRPRDALDALLNGLPILHNYISAPAAEANQSTRSTLAI